MLPPNQTREAQGLIVWQKAMDLAEKNYRITNRFPKHQLFGLVSQLARPATKDYKQFLRIALRSLYKVVTILKIANIGYIEPKIYNNLIKNCDEVGALLNGLIKFSKT